MANGIQVLSANDYVKVTNRYLREDGSVGTWTFPLDHFLYDTLYARKIFGVNQPSALPVSEKLRILDARSAENYRLRKNVETQPKGANHATSKKIRGV